MALWDRVITLTDDYGYSSVLVQMSLAQAEACFRSGRVEECSKLLEAGRLYSHNYLALADLATT